MHHLVAGYLQYKPEPLEHDGPDEANGADDLTVSATPVVGNTPWMQGFGSVPASSELRSAATAEDALAAAERMFFGPLMEI